MSNPSGRTFAEVPEEGAVVFLVGMRINSFWQIRKWFPVFAAMPRMISELMRNPGLGLVGRPRIFLSGRTILVWQQWVSYEHLEAYARGGANQHLPAWRAFNRNARGNGAVGVFHETYLVTPSTAEAIYVNMPPLGLGAAFGTKPAEGAARSSAGRLGRSSQASEPAISA